jgi:hypothetical protein
MGGGLAVAVAFAVTVTVRVSTDLTVLVVPHPVNARQDASTSPPATRVLGFHAW